MEWTAGPADTWDRMAAWLGDLSNTLTGRPAAIIVVSAHWEAAAVAVTSGEQPPLIYDYSGFPPHTYELRYPAPGNPALARDICARLNEAGIASIEDRVRGFDHGVFIPLMLMYPQADIPVVQISLHASLDPAAHLAIGRALAPLRSRNILLLGSGLSYHNLARMMSTRPLLEDSDEFDTWLSATCALPRSAREAQLCEWSSAPAARSAHPREEHLLPLMVAAGAGGAAGAARVYHDRVMGSTVSAFAFE